jgi:hypothetical protein
LVSSTTSPGTSCPLAGSMSTCPEVYMVLLTWAT